MAVDAPLGLPQPGHAAGVIDLLQHPFCPRRAARRPGCGHGLAGSGPQLLTEVSDPGVARAKLQWWRDELLRTQAGEPRHPLSQALAPVMARHRLPAQGFLDMADQVQADLDGDQPADSAALEGACERDLGALFELLARCQGQETRVAWPRPEPWGASAPRST